MFKLTQITLDHNLAAIAQEINSAIWDDANDMGVYDAAALTSYLHSSGSVFIACHEVTDDRSKLLGIASARVQLKPYDHERWLYIDEVDVCADQRQRGVGSAIMRKLMEVANEQNCAEVWLGTEVDNKPANALYTALAPSDIEQVVGYTWELD